MEFPKIKFAKTNSIMEQWLHLRSEVMEVQNAINDMRMINDDEALIEALAVNAIEECLDMIHSAETLIRVIRREYRRIDLEAIKQEVICKNAMRGYYDEEDRV